MASVAAKLSVVDFKVGHRPTRLAPPTVSTQDFQTQSFVWDGIEPQTRGLLANSAHAAALPRFLRKTCFWASGRKWKNLVAENSRVSGSPLSRLAPARKSAQIISRQ